MYPDSNLVLYPPMHLTAYITNPFSNLVVTKERTRQLKGDCKDSIVYNRQEAKLVI